MLSHPLHPSPSVLTQQAGDDLVLVHARTGSAFRLNATGRILWERLAQGGATQPELVDALAAVFDQPRERLEADVDTLVRELLESELVVRDPDP